VQQRGHGLFYPWQRHHMATVPMVAMWCLCHG